MPWLRTAWNRLTAYAGLVRFEHTLFSLPVAVSGMLLADPHPALADLAWVLVAMFGARTAAMALNRWADRDLDALNPRTAGRELPAGKVSSRETLLLIGGGFLIYLLAAFRLSPWCGYLAPIPAVVFVLYPYLKRWTWICHAGIGAALGLSPLGGFLAVTKTPSAAISHPHFPMVLSLALFVVLWVGSFDIYYGILDIDFDRAHGVHAIPARFGPRIARRVAFAGHLIGGLLLGAALFPLFASWAPFAAGWTLLMALFVAEYLLVRKGHIETAFFQVNVAVGATVLILFFAGTGPLG